MEMLAEFGIKIQKGIDAIAKRVAQRYIRAR